MRLGIARWAAPAAIVLLAITLHWSLLDKGFVSDDLSQVLNNPYLRSPRSLGQIFSSHVWSFRGPEEKSNYYRPMMHLLYMACYGLFGLESAGFHAANLLFHAGCSLLVFYLGRALGAAWCAGPSALLAALLFAVHPVHTEAIAWIAAVTELSYAFFFLLSVYLYVRGRPAWSAAVAMLALLSKETALMLLPLLVVYEHWFRKPGGRRAYLYHLVPLVIYSGAAHPGARWAGDGVQSVLTVAQFSRLLDCVSDRNLPEQVGVSGTLPSAGSFWGPAARPPARNVGSCHLPAQLGILIVLGSCGLPGRGRRLAPVAWPGVVVRRALGCPLAGARPLPVPGGRGQLFRRAVSLPAFGGFLLDCGGALSGAAYKECRLRLSFAELRPAHLLSQC